MATVTQEEFDDLASALAEVFHDVGMPIALGLRDQIAGRLIESPWYAGVREAEAELSNVEADYDRRGDRLWRLAAKAGHTPHESDNDATAEHVVALALATAQQGGTTREEWRINGPEGPSFAIDQAHPEAEKWSRRVADQEPGRYVERRTVTTFSSVMTEWERA